MMWPSKHPPRVALLWGTPLRLTNTFSFKIHAIDFLKNSASGNLVPETKDWTDIAGRIRAESNNNDNRNQSLFIFKFLVFDVFLQDSKIAH